MSIASLSLMYALLAVGAAGLFLCLPSEKPKSNGLRWAAAILGAAALAALATGLARWIGSTFPGRPIFIVFGLIAVLGAVRVVSHPRPLYCALYLVLVILSVTALCVLAAANFLAIALVIVYAGAILVVYVFVIMLSRQQQDDPANLTSREPLAAVTLGFLLAAAVNQVMASGPMVLVTSPPPPTVQPAQAEQRAEIMSAAIANPASVNGEVGNVARVGEVLMTTYIVAVEIAGILLLVALIGAVALARKHIDPGAFTAIERQELEEEKDIGRIGREVPPF